MTHSSISVAKIAKLARLHATVSPEYTKKYEHELATILEYVDQLSNAPLSLQSANTRCQTIAELRPDEILADQLGSKRIRDNIIALFPHQSNSLLILPGIFAE